MTIDGDRWLPHSVTGPGNHLIIDANNVDVLHTVIGDDDYGTIVNVDGPGPDQIFFFLILFAPTGA